jgi:hypothetical protein
VLFRSERGTIYYVERDFIGQNFGEYESVRYDEDALAKVKAADKLACASPTEANIQKATQLRAELESQSEATTIYFKDAVVMQMLGSSFDPVWFNPDEDDNFDADNYPLVNIPTDDNGNAVYGQFYYDWTPSGRIREGDYFICWTWTPYSAGESISDHQQFSLLGDPRAVVTVPSHTTPEGKYETLLERYLPDMYKNSLLESDMTPEVTEKLNLAIAAGFTYLEDMANQIIDLYDANAVHESLLVYLANLFNLKLKSNDPTLWRRQIKEAIPLFKKKGTERGLRDAFSQAGMRLNKLTRLWQVVSPYTWQESFLAKDVPAFSLSKNIITPINDDHFGLWLRRAGEDEYTEISKDNVSFSSSECDFNSVMTWVGDQKSSSPMELYEGDILRVLYQYNTIPSGEESTEAYIRSLSYGDKRDEADQEFPPKNWNVRMIEEDDPMFDTIIPVRHPFHDPLVFGKIRTEFAFSENIFNMEEFNGSIRDSIDPCNIGKEFIDPCGGSLSSKFNIDVGIENLSDDRIVEVGEILKEYMPFHAQPHTISYEGEINEFIQSPVEEIEMLINFVKSEYILSGNANPFFNRELRYGLPNWEVLRNQLAETNTVVSGATGDAYNTSIRLYSPDINFQEVGIRQSSHVMTILSPSPNYGEYTLRDFNRSTCDVVEGAVEPLDTSMFSFNLYNITYRTNSASITQDDVFKFADDSADFTAIGVKTVWDVDNEPSYTGDAWTITIGEYQDDPYTILDILPDGKLLIHDPDRTLPTSNTSSLDWSLSDGDEVAAGETGVLTVSRQAKIDLDDSEIDDQKYYSRQNDFVVYDGINYPILNLDGHELYIGDYEDGDASGVTIKIYRPLVKEGVGYFGYSGLRLETTTDYEVSLGIENGQNPTTSEPIDDNNFIENYLIQIGDDYFRISDIDSTTISLDGVPQEWTTANAGGTAVSFSIIHFTKSEIDIHFNVFDQLDRDGKDAIVREIYDSNEEDSAVEILSQSGGPQDNVQPNEGVSFTIEYRDGTTQQGDL